MSPQPFVENSVGVSVQQDKDGVIGRKVSLAPCAVQEQVCKVVEASHHGIIVPLGSAVACVNKIKMHEERRSCWKRNPVQQAATKKKKDFSKERKKKITFNCISEAL